MNTVDRKIQYFNSVYNKDKIMEFKLQKFWSSSQASEDRFKIMIENNYNKDNQTINSLGLSKEQFLLYFLSYSVELDIKIN